MDFKIKQQLEGYEMDITLLRLVNSLNKDIRSSLDIATRVGNEEFLIALPGAPLNSAKMIAHKK